MAVQEAQPAQERADAEESEAADRQPRRPTQGQRPRRPMGEEAAVGTKRQGQWGRSNCCGAETARAAG